MTHTQSASTVTGDEVVPRWIRWLVLVPIAVIALVVTVLGNDPMMICDPLGYPRLFAYNYGFEFVVLPNRVVQFFEFGQNKIQYRDFDWHVVRGDHVAERAARIVRVADGLIVSDERNGQAAA